LDEVVEEEVVEDFWRDSNGVEVREARDAGSNDGADAPRRRWGQNFVSSEFENTDIPKTETA